MSLGAEREGPGAVREIRRRGASRSRSPSSAARALVRRRAEHRARRPPGADHRRAEGHALRRRRGGALVDAQLELTGRNCLARLRPSASPMPSSWILRVSVLRPMPSRFAASMRRPPVCASALGSAPSRTGARARRGCRSRRAPGAARLPARAPRPSRRPRPRRLLAEFRRQVGDVDHLARRHHRQPVAEVLELAHVARQILRARGTSARRPTGAWARRRARARSSARKCRASSGMSSRRSRSGGRRRRITFRRWKRSSRNRPCAHARLEVLVRGGDDAHVGLDRLVAADAVEAAVGQHAQQPRLQLRRHVADLVEEQRAAFGLLEAAAAHAPARR